MVAVAQEIKVAHPLVRRMLVWFLVPPLPDMGKPAGWSIKVCHPYSLLLPDLLPGGHLHSARHWWITVGQSSSHVLLSTSSLSLHSTLCVYMQLLHTSSDLLLEKAETGKRKKKLTTHPELKQWNKKQSEWHFQQFNRHQEWFLFSAEHKQLFVWSKHKRCCIKVKCIYSAQAQEGECH